MSDFFGASHLYKIAKAYLQNSGMEFSCSFDKFYLFVYGENIYKIHT